MHLALAVSLTLILAPVGRAAEPPAFTRLKALAGSWRGTEADGSPASVRYEVVANGSALKEELRMGTTPSMVSFYYPDGDQVMMTHYCLTRTQPRMRTVAIHPDLSQLALAYVDATNVLRSTGGMMDSVRFRFEDDDHFEQIWGASAVTEDEVPVRFVRAAAAEVDLGEPPAVPRGESRAERALAMLAAYQGEWVGTSEDGGQIGLSLVPISGGTAVLETLTLAPGSTMLTVYHLDGEQLMLTHYCSSRTQPRMRTAAIPEDLGRFEFGPMDATNVLSSTAAFMKSLAWEPGDADHFRMTWNQDVAGSVALPLSFARRPPKPDDGGEQAPHAAP